MARNREVESIITSYLAMTKHNTYEAQRDYAVLFKRLWEFGLQVSRDGMAESAKQICVAAIERRRKEQAKQQHGNITVVDL